MIDLKLRDKFGEKIDRLSAIKKQMADLKEEKDLIEASILEKCTADLENTKYKTVHYHGEDADLTATTAETIKVTYDAFLPYVFGKAYKDAVSESVSHNLTAAAKRMLIGMWKGNYIRQIVRQVIDQMTGVSYNEKKELYKRCKGINYDKDVANIQKFTSLSEQDAKEYAYMMAEAEIWQEFSSLLNLNGITEESEIQELIQKIQAAFVVEDSTKISIT